MPFFFSGVCCHQDPDFSLSVMVREKLIDYETTPPTVFFLYKVYLVTYLHTQKKERKQMQKVYEIKHLTSSELSMF